jgi:CTP:molybdopterin cytidylyltransferase MocA
LSHDLPNSEQFRIVAKEYVDADAAASLLEELKSATLSQQMLALGDMPVSKAEMQVKASENWKQYIEGMCAARKRSNKLKLQIEYIKMKYGEQQSAEATARAERRL